MPNDMTEEERQQLIHEIQSQLYFEKKIPSYSI